MLPFSNVLFHQPDRRGLYKTCMKDDLDSENRNHANDNQVHCLYQQQCFKRGFPQSPVLNLQQLKGGTFTTSHLIFTILRTFCWCQMPSSFFSLYLSSSSSADWTVSFTTYSIICFSSGAILFSFFPSFSVPHNVDIRLQVALCFHLLEPFILNFVLFLASSIIFSMSFFASTFLFSPSPSVLYFSASCIIFSMSFFASAFFLSLSSSICTFQLLA